LLVLAAGWANAQDAGLQVDHAVTALGVEAREPVGEATSFPADVDRVFLFSRIVGAQGDTAVYHVWKHGEMERAKVELAVRSSSWRTWSSKRILPSWTGEWTVEIQDTAGNVLESVSFVIEGAGG
jgi:hypothetical protein